MKILFLNNEYPPLGGGTGTVNRHLFEEFRNNQRLTIDLVTSKHAPETPNKVPHSDQITIYYVNVNNKNIHHSTAIELIRYTIKSLILSIKLTKSEPYDIIFAFSTVPAGFVGAVISKIFKIPLVISLQGPDIPGFEPRYRLLYPFLKPLIRYLWRNSSRVITLSKQHQELAEKTLKLDFVKIPNGNSLSTRSTQNIKEGTADSVRYICVARLIKRKGLEFLLQGFSELCKMLETPCPKLSIVGTGDLHAALVTKTIELGLEDRVQFHGFVAPEKMHEVYEQSDIFVMTSMHEGMSMAMLEAMSFGLPVITTKVGGVDELIVGKNSGVVTEYGDNVALKEAMLSLAENPAKRKEMGAQAKEVAATFSWGNIAEQYIDLFDSVLADRNKPDKANS